ncbi:cytochrome P450 [Mycobacterium riyadhense]|uniref:cytochrome P450 n=1 Tax=Mycobacterium riyadhense TaxID=486698 RepID=UPI00195E0169|nr:cytochrome P450 [Mycobacterium riyadhense]
MTTPPPSTGRLEIDFSVYNPFDPEFIRHPFPVINRMREEYPVAFHKGLNAWLISGHDLEARVMRSAQFSTRYADWKHAPPSPPEDQWTLFDRCLAKSMLSVGQAEHMRLRRLTAPAFSRRVMDKIEDNIRCTVVGVFNEIEDPRLFNVATEIAAKVPIRSIAQMIGVPHEADELFEDGLGRNLVRAIDPMYAAERDTYVRGSLPGLQYLLDTIADRRRSDDPGDDFIGTLVSTVIDDERLSDMEILSVIWALVVAGADTAVDLHTLAIRALLLHPDQRRLLREQPELMGAAILEVLRWSAHPKLGSIPRFPLEDIELGGQVLEKGSFVMMLAAAAWLDPAKWPEPQRFDITRNHSGNIIFGAGPHMCLGLNLAQAQAKLMIEEFERRFGGTAELVGEIEYDPGHINARRITKMMVATAAS